MQQSCIRRQRSRAGERAACAEAPDAGGRGGCDGRGERGEARVGGGCVGEDGDGLRARAKQHAASGRTLVHEATEGVRKAIVRFA